MNHYETLGVSKTASLAEIKSAFRKKVKQVHPDLNPGADEQAFIQMNEAYEVLSDATSRSLYDLYLDGVPVKTEIETVTPQQRYREQYKWRKAKEARDRVQSQIVYRQLFYRKLRIVNVACFILSLLLSYDYYRSPTELVFNPGKVEYLQSSTRIYLEDGSSIRTSASFYKDYVAADVRSVRLTSSPLFSIFKRISVVGARNSYSIKGSIYVFGNAIGVLLFIFSLIVVANRSYTDSRLTFGVFAVVILLWTIAMILIYA